jgi:putative FmdB family regulatory protein
MPIYEYRCRVCDKTFEKLVFGGVQPPCPYCQSVELDKLMSGFAFRSTSADGSVVKSSAKSCSGCSSSTCVGCH